MIAEFNKWFSDNGEHLRYDYDLNENSVVLDVGVYNGEFSKNISDKYNCRVYGFEPVNDFFCRSNKFLGNYPKIKLFNFGLGNSNRIETIYLKEDSSTIFSSINDILNSKYYTQINIRSIIDIINELSLVHIDLIKLNVEGCEFEILDAIIDANYTTLFKNIQVQFHECVNDCYEKRQKIIDKLLETHEFTYCYKFVWENLKRVR